MFTRPSGEEITVSGPLKTMTALFRLALRASSILLGHLSFFENELKTLKNSPS